MPSAATSPIPPEPARSSGVAGATAVEDYDGGTGPGLLAAVAPSDPATGTQTLWAGRSQFFMNSCTVNTLVVPSGQVPHTAAAPIWVKAGSRMLAR